MLNGFIADCRARDLNRHTIATYKSDVKYFLQACPDPCTVNLDDLKSFLVELRDRGLKGSTLKGYFAAISTFYEYPILEGAMKFNPVPTFRKRYLRVKQQYNGENTRQLISVEDMGRLLNLVNKDILAKTIMLFLAKTGVRRGELIAMDVFDLDLEKGEFRVKPFSKRSNRLGFMDAELIAVLREYLDWRESKAADKALWINPSGSRVSRNYVYNTVVSTASLIGLHDPHGPLNKKFGPHCCRHFFTTHLRKGGMKREFIQELRGDRRKDAIDIYDHVDPEELRQSYLECIPHLGVGPGRGTTLQEYA